MDHLFYFMPASVQQKILFGGPCFFFPPDFWPGEMEGTIDQVSRALPFGPDDAVLAMRPWADH